MSTVIFSILGGAVALCASCVPDDPDKKARQDFERHVEQEKLMKSLRGF